MEILTLISQICACLTGVAAAWLLLTKPVRSLIAGSKGLWEGQRCLLRSSMLHTYYKNRESKAIRQYEFQNFLASYKAYKALGGNSFIDSIHKEVATWTVVT